MEELEVEWIDDFEEEEKIYEQFSPIEFYLLDKLKK